MIKFIIVAVTILAVYFTVGFLFAVSTVKIAVWLDPDLFHKDHRGTLSKEKVADYVTGATVVWPAVMIVGFVTIASKFASKIYKSLFEAKILAQLEKK